MSSSGALHRLSERRDPVSILAGTVLFANGPRLLVFDGFFFTVLAFPLKVG
jgi:hypothetical protein